MAILQLPDLGQKMLPFAILLGGVFTFVRLSRSRELVATRAAGVSAWDFLLPPLTVAVFIGVFAVTVFTPISAKMFSANSPSWKRAMSRARKASSRSRSTVSGCGRATRHQQSVIHALRVAEQGEHLEDVLVFLYGPNDTFLGRIDASSAQLQDHYWILNDAWVSDTSGACAGASRHLRAAHHADAGTDRGKLGSARHAFLLGPARAISAPPRRPAFPPPNTSFISIRFTPCPRCSPPWCSWPPVSRSGWGATAAWPR